MASPPSTAWREQIAPDEAARHAAQAEGLTALQAARTAKHGVGRALHAARSVGFGAVGVHALVGQKHAHARPGQHFVHAAVTGVGGGFGQRRLGRVGLAGLEFAQGTAEHFEQVAGDAQLVA